MRRKAVQYCSVSVRGKRYNIWLKRRIEDRAKARTLQSQGHRILFSRTRTVLENLILTVAISNNGVKPGWYL